MVFRCAIKPLYNTTGYGRSPVPKTPPFLGDSAAQCFCSMSLIMKKPKIKAKPLCSRLRSVNRAAAERAKQKGQDPELAKHAAVIRTLGKRVVTDIIEIGRRLTEAKKLVVHGNATAADGGWAGWLQTEFQWSEGTATNFMRVYELAENYKSINFTDLTFADLVIAPSALYVLARPSTPDQVRDEIMDRARAGEAITHSTVQEARAAHLAAVVQESLAPAADEAAITTNETETAADTTTTETAATEAGAETETAATEATADTTTTETAATDTDTDPVEELRRWWRDLVMRAGRAMEDGEVADSPLSPGRRQILQEVVEPTLLPTLRKGGEGLIKLGDFLGRLLDEASREDEAPEEANGRGGRT
jgi:hypothetical protein